MLSVGAGRVGRKRPTSGAQSVAKYIYIFNLYIYIYIY